MNPKKMPKNYKDIFFRPKIVSVFLAIDGNSIMDIWKKSKMSNYSYVFLLMDSFKKLNLIRTEKIGMKVIVSLTEEGKDLKSVLEAVYDYGKK